MARGSGQLGGPHRDTVTMPKRGKRLKFRAHDACSGRVTVADYANSDPAVVRSGRVKKAVANAIQQEVKSLCGLEASQVPAEEALSGVGEPCDILDSSDEMDAQEESTQERLQPPIQYQDEPFAARISKNPAIPESTPSTLKNSKCLLFWCRKIVGNRQEPMWEFNFKFKKQSPRLKSKCMERLQPPIQYPS